MSHDLPDVTIYTDGGCRPNPGPGGWGAVILFSGKKPAELSGGHPETTTNNRMELTAAVEALRSLEAPHAVKLYTDSKYVRQGITEWLDRWQRNGWRTSGKTEVKNQDLWQELAAQVGRHRVRWHWTRGHSGDRWNERADRLASAAIPRPDLPLDDEDAVHLFTAAAYSGKTRTGAWAVVLLFRDNERCLHERVEGTSANRMHLQAAVAGLETLTRPVRVHLYTTSDYVVDGATGWIKGWQARGWKTRDGKSVSHKDLWQRIARQCSRHRAHWHVVPREERPDPMAEAKRVASADVKGDGLKVEG